MIAFDLNCGNGHQFEGWFGSSTEFDAQKTNGQLVCPLCGDATVQKALSVPHVPRKANQRGVALPPITGPLSESSIEAPVTETIPPSIVELVQHLARAQTEMLDKSQWVGENFAEAARAIHYGEEAERRIHGQTSKDEAKALIEEGISVAPLLFPVVPPSAKN